MALVDSTRKGKRFPDSFSRTIPIWATVVNRALYRFRQMKEGKDKPTLDEIPADWKDLCMPDWIPRTEQFIVATKLEEFCDLLLTTEAMKPMLDDMIAHITKPLQCHWVCPGTHPLKREKGDSSLGKLNSLELPSDDRLWLVLVCPSEQQHIVGWNHGWYIQGAADDEESWSQGLTATLFWKNKDLLLSREDKLEETIEEIVANESNETRAAVLSYNNADENSASAIVDASDHDKTLIKESVTWLVPGMLAISDKPAACSPLAFSVFDLVINCSAIEYEAMKSTYEQCAKDPVTAHKVYMHVLDPFEKGSNVKYKVSRRLPATLEFTKRYLRASNPSSNTEETSSNETTLVIGRPLLIHGVEALEVAIGLAVGVLSANWDDTVSYILPQPRRNEDLSKVLIKQFLLYVTKLEPTQLPSSMISDLNRFFLTKPVGLLLEHYNTLVLCVP